MWHNLQDNLWQHRFGSLSGCLTGCLLARCQEVCSAKMIHIEFTMLTHARAVLPLHTAQVWHPIVFDTPFTYGGGDIIIDIQHGAATPVEGQGAVAVPLEATPARQPAALLAGVDVGVQCAAVRLALVGDAVVPDLTVPCLVVSLVVQQ